MEKRAYAQRMLNRPGSQPAKGVLNEDLGSGFDIPNRPIKQPARRGVVVDSDDEDELDFLPPSSSQPPARREREDTDDVIKRLKFHKNKKDGEIAPTSKENTEQRNADMSAQLTAMRGKRNEEASSSSSSTTRPLRDNAITRNQSFDARVGAKRGAGSVEKGVKAGEVKSERPKPRPIHKAPRSPQKPSGSQSSKSVAKLSAASSFEGSPSSANGKKQVRVAPSAFPVMSPLGDAKGKGKGRETDRHPRKEPETEGRKGKGKEKEKDGLRVKRGFPEAGLSPLSSPTKTLASFLPSPLGTPQATPNRKQRLAATEFPAPSPLRAEGHAKPKRKALPFPMNTQLFEGSPASSPSKRRSPASDDDDRRDRKRSRNQPVLLAESYDYEEDSELLFLAPGTDPKTLCPYCDTPLPPQPTPLLTRLLEETFKKSYREVRPSNPLGRKAPMGVFVGVCQRHRFESETLPEAEARGWPKYIDWAGLSDRVLAMERDLELILADPGDTIVYGNDNEDGKKQKETPRQLKGPRMRCIFWKDLVKELKTKGSKGVKGVQGQFANFEKTQPGYYGELGSVIIHQTLYDMFPLTAIDPHLVDPLTPNEFIQRILVPEVGMRLVMEDMGLDLDDRADKQHAVAVLQESASYGVAMFPEDGGEGGGEKKHKGRNEEAMGVAEQMIMERARKRRKELEVEEAEEDEMWRLQEQKEEAERQREKAEIAKQKRRAARKAKKEAAEVVVVADLTPVVARPRPRPVPKNKGKPVTADSASDMDTDSSADPRHFKNGSGTDVGMVISNSSGAEEELELVLGPTPKTRSRHADKLLATAKLSDSDSDFPRELNLAGPSSKPKAKSKKRAAPASSGFEAESESDNGRVEASPRPRSPSASLTSSRRSTRGSSVVDLCSSSEDGGGSGVGGSSKSKARKPQAVETPRRKPRKSNGQVLPTSSEEDEMGAEADVTPRASRTPRLKTPSAPSVTSSGFRPLDAARARAPSARGEPPRQKWMVSMAQEVSGSEGDSVQVRNQESHSWLLDDVSQS